MYIYVYVYIYMCMYIYIYIYHPNDSWFMGMSCLFGDFLLEFSHDMKDQNDNGQSRKISNFMTPIYWASPKWRDMEHNYGKSPFSIGKP